MADKVEICNMALDLIGHGGRLDSLDVQTPEAEACKLHFQSTYETCIDFYNWSFTRRDEVIDKSDLLTNVYALPYQHAYRLPEDVLRVLYLMDLDASSLKETQRLQLPDHIQFDLRNYNGQKILATDHEPNFVIEYQAYVDMGTTRIPPTFTAGLTYLLASKLAPSLVRGTEGLTMGTRLYQLAMTELKRASDYDTQQSVYSLGDHLKPSSFLGARK